MKKRQQTISKEVMKRITGEEMSEKYISNLLKKQDETKRIQLTIEYLDDQANNFPKIVASIGVKEFYENIKNDISLLDTMYYTISSEFLKQLKDVK